MSEKLDKVKRGLEACSIGTVCGPNCPYEDFRVSDSEEEDNYNCVATLARDALKLLEDLEIPAPTVPVARMLTFNEAMNNASNFRDRPDSVRPVFVQFRAEEYKDESMTPPWRGGVNQRALLKDATRYYRDFVFWTERPLASQMEEVEWIS